MIKVPGTAAGVPAIEELTARGVNVNVTLLFSLERYEQVIEAYLRGLSGAPQRRRAAGRRSPRSRRSSSRAWTRRPTRSCPPGSPLRGRVAIANAALRLRRSGGRVRRAGVGAARHLGAHAAAAAVGEHRHQDPAYSDVLYVEELIAPGVINTMPMSTLRAFADHGVAGAALAADDARGGVDRAAAAGSI